MVVWGGGGGWRGGGDVLLFPLSLSFPLLSSLVNGCSPYRS